VSNGARIGLLVGTIAALVLAFVLLSPGDDDEPDTATAPTATVPAMAPASPGDDPAQTTTDVTPPPAPAFETIRIRDAKPVGGVQTVAVKQGDRVRIRVTSPDTSDEIHLHGYDKYADVAPGRAARFSFEANAEGIFEIELHGTGTQIGKLVVEP
jgi:FtsP/CotA-like multicopper oxidase with cupredoxin domain